MASLQEYNSHGRRYYRIVESFRKDGKPRIRVLAHLGKVDDLLELVQGVSRPLKVHSVSAGAVTALHRLAQELDLAGKINQVLQQAAGRVQKRDQLTVGESLLAGMIGRACAPGSKRAFQEWASQTCLPELMGFKAERATSQLFWDQMEAVPVEALGKMEELILQKVVRIEQLQLQAVVYDTTNFYTYLATTNGRSRLAERGHSKQRRHDLRQLGLALVVDEASQLPLFHQLQAGSRADVRVLADLIRPVQKRLRKLTGQSRQLTLILDSGASSQENPEDIGKTGHHFVSALRPSDHRRWLEEKAGELAPVVLSTGEEIKAYRERRRMRGAERDLVLLFSPRLYEGQRRGLAQQLERCRRQLEAVRSWSGYKPETVVRRLDKILGRQYVRRLMSYEVKDAPGGGSQIRIWSDLEEYRRLRDRYFGLRVLVTDRQDWTTAQIIESYRAQSRVESSFLDLKDPGMLSPRPQFHWTDQKLHVHTFMCVMSYLLVRLLWWRLRREGMQIGSPRHLLAQLKKIRLSHIVQVTGKAGRPRVTRQIEDLSGELERLGRLTRAFPTLR